MNASSTPKLKDIIPREAEIELEVDGLPAVYTLRKWSLACDAWIENTFNESRQEFFTDLKVSKLAKLVFYLLKDKAKFAAKKVDDYDNDGNKVTRIMTAPERVAEAIVGEQKVLDITNAVLACIGYSNTAAVEVKKKAAKIAKQ